MNRINVPQDDITFKYDNDLCCLCLYIYNERKMMISKELLLDIFLPHVIKLTKEV